MRILFLTQIIPFPPDAGPKVKTWHVLRYLAEMGHEVVLASFMRPEERPFVTELKRVCTEVHTVPIKRSRFADALYLLKSQVSGRPFLVERDDLREMRSLVRSLILRGNIDAIHADQLTMAQFALPDEEIISSKAQAEPMARAKFVVGSNGSRTVREWPLLVFDAHNAVWTIVERMRENAAWFLKPLAALEARRIKRYEGEILQLFDHTLAVTEPDREALLQAFRTATREKMVRAPRITVIPISVDTEKIRPVARSPHALHIVTMGTLHYLPNADGIRWFLNEVFPLVRKQLPEVKLTILGKNPPRDFLQAAEENPEFMAVTGYVEDLKPYFEKATLMVVAVRAGGGMRVRILEAFAWGMPVITTTVGLEGIDAIHPEEVVVADSTQDFAAAVIRLLQDPALQERLAHSGRLLAENKYDWKVSLNKIGQVYKNLATEIVRGGMHDQTK